MGCGRRNGFCVTIVEISYLVVCIFPDLVQPSCENNKQKRNKEIISMTDVSSPDLSVASYAARFRGNS